MRLFGSGSIAPPAKAVLDVCLVIATFLVAAELVVALILLGNPRHAAREYFQATTLAVVPPDVWSPAGVVTTTGRLADARVDAWAYIRYRAESRWFVVVTAGASFMWWACVFLMLLQLRRALANLSAGSPFPRANVRCIRLTGLAILGLAGVQLAIDAVMLAFMRATTTVAGGPPTVPTDVLLVDFPLGTLMAGGAVVILAEVFRAGADLQDDQELTV
jgi:hypothetical protein